MKNLNKKNQKKKSDFWTWGKIGVRDPTLNNGQLGNILIFSKESNLYKDTQKRKAPKKIILN